MGLTFRRFVADDADALVGFLTSEPWPFHVTAVVSQEQARRRIDDGDFDGEAAQSSRAADTSRSRTTGTPGRALRTGMSATVWGTRYSGGTGSRARQPSRTGT